MEGHTDDNRPRIIHQNTPRIGEEAPSEPQPAPAPPQQAGEMRSSKIRTFERARAEEKTWKRKPNTPGTGAVHVKTFHSKLTEDALRYMDDTINEWLENHPELEVKFVTSTIGVFTGKLKEPQMITQVWV
jgi:hypothetical protein